MELQQRAAEVEHKVAMSANYASTSSLGAGTSTTDPVVAVGENFDDFYTEVMFANKTENNQRFLVHWGYVLILHNCW